MTALAHHNIYWIEEPTAPDDAHGHAQISKAMKKLGIRVATGEHCHNRILHKNMMVNDSYQTVQCDPVRLGGICEILLVMLMAAKAKKPVCLHAGGVALCEMGVHMSIFDYIGISGTHKDRFFEYSGALHEHFPRPCTIKNGHFVAPLGPGLDADLLQSSVDKYIYPSGPYWSKDDETVKYKPFKGIMCANFTPINNDGSVNLE